MPHAVTTGRLIGSFLASIKLSLAPSTVKLHEHYLLKLKRTDAERPAELITDAFLTGWVAKTHGRKSSNTQHDAASAVMRMLNWAIAEKLLKESPLRHYRKPLKTRREAVVTAPQYAACLRAARGPLRDAIKFLHHTGCRPQELRVIELQWLNGRIFRLPLEHSKGKRERRKILLDDTAFAIAARLGKQYPRGPLFRNSDGAAWTKDCLGLAFRRLGKTTRIDGLCAYAFRHGFITRLLEKGVDAASVAAISGNSARMVLEVYNHVGENDERLFRFIA